MTRWLLAALVVIAVAGPAGAQDLESEARAIESLLIAPCCFSQQVSVHQSPAAAEAKQEIRRRLAAGETREQILQAFAAQHGTRVLAVPPAEGFKRTLYVVPLLLFVGSIAGGVVLLRRFTRQAPRPAEEPAPAAVAPNGYGAQLDEQLRDLD